MRYWVNSQLSSNSPVYNAMMGVMNSNATLFGEQLISVTMRTDILTEIERSLGVDRFGELKIGFALVTGIGSGTKLSEQQIRSKQSLLNVPTGSAIDIRCVLTGLQHLDDPKGNRVGEDGSIAKTETFGDMILEGRFGNSLRLGYRHKNPLILISNGRTSTFLNLKSK